ncbi:hypothetical protein [Proteus faecis]
MDMYGLVIVSNASLEEQLLEGLLKTLKSINTYLIFIVSLFTLSH